MTRRPILSANAAADAQCDHVFKFCFFSSKIFPTLAEKEQGIKNNE